MWHRLIIALFLFIQFQCNGHIYECFDHVIFDKTYRDEKVATSILIPPLHPMDCKRKCEADDKCEAFSFHFAEKICKFCGYAKNDTDECILNVTSNEPTKQIYLSCFVRCHKNKKYNNFVIAQHALVGEKKKIECNDGYYVKGTKGETAVDAYCKVVEKSKDILYSQFEFNNEVVECLEMVYCEVAETDEHKNLPSTKIGMSTTWTCKEGLLEKSSKKESVEVECRNDKQFYKTDGQKPICIKNLVGDNALYNKVNFQSVEVECSNDNQFYKTDGQKPNCIKDTAATTSFHQWFFSLVICLGFRFCCQW